MTFSLSLVLEKLLHQLATFVFEDTTNGGTLGVQGVWGIHGKTTLVVVAAIDDAGNLAPTESTGTHHAGLYGDVEGAVCEVFAAQFVGSHGDGLHLGVSCHVV